MELVVRSRIGPYEMAAHLDSGGMADVYLAHGDDLTRPLVVKVMRLQHKGVAEIVGMFREEVRLMRRLSHRNVVQVLDDGEEDGCPWIAMEYLEGDHLGTLLRAARRKGTPLAPTTVARLGLEVSRGLAYVHGLTNPDSDALGLVHRDVSPQNIFLCYSGEVKLLDFGIAKALDRNEATRTGLLKGKLTYMSPEQVRRTPLDPRSDLFSLGIVLWELTTGRRLYKASNEYDIMKRICEQSAPPVTAVRPQTPPALVGIIERLLQSSPEDRYPTADALADALERFLDTQIEPEDELVHVAQSLLSGRRKKKATLVETVLHEGELQVRLFGDLVDSLDEAGSDELSFEPDRPATGPERIRARRVETDIANAPLVEEDDEPPGSGPEPGTAGTVGSAPPHTRAGRRIWPALVVAAIILGAAGWLLWHFVLATDAATPGDHAQAIHASPSGAPPQPVGVLVSSKTLKRRSKRSLVTIHVDRKVEVSEAGRTLGRSPIEGAKMSTGEHTLDLIDPDRGQVKRMTIRALPGKHLTYRVAF